MNNAIKNIAACAVFTWARGINNAEKRPFSGKNRALAGLAFWLCAAAFHAPGAHAQAATVSSASTTSTTTTRWTCNAFYLPVRNIWQRTVAVQYDGEVIRSVQIDDVPVYTFTVEGSSLLTAVDGERIQFDVAELTWTSDLRGLASSSGRCAL